MNDSRSGRSPAPLKAFQRLGLGLSVALAASLAGTRGTQDAVANGDTRTLSFVHTHTKEAVTVTFRRHGRYDSSALEKLNWLLRDWRRDEPTKMDPRLFDIVWEVYRQVGAREPVNVVSAYRSTATNSMLRRRSRGVAKHSQHTLGKALDFHLPDVPVERVRAVGMRLQRGGVGYYPSSYTPFVHLDAGSVRSWPRMTREQLARLFPDGRTVHLPADGRPLPGYEEARAEVLARGGTVAGYTTYADANDGAFSGRRRSLWATLFGGDDEEEDGLEATRGSRRRPAARSTAVAAYVPNAANSDDAGMYAVFANPASPPALGRAPAEARRTARSETRVAALPREPQAVADAPAAAASAPIQASRIEEAPKVPVPAPRPASVTPEVPTRVAAAGDPGLGARMSWQQGPAGQAAPSGPARQADEGGVERTAAVLPLPPRRPDDMAPVVSGLAEAPMPPTRPVALAAAGQVESFGPSMLLRGSAAPGPSPDAPAAGAVRHAPPARQDAPATRTAGASPAATTVPRSSLPAAGDERAALRALFVAAVTETVPAAPVRVATSRARPEPVAYATVASARTVLDLGFSSAPAGELRPDRFTGPAVKPLPVRR